MNRENIRNLKVYAEKIRRGVLEMVFNAGSGHIPSALSIVDILVVLYQSVMHVDPKKPLDPNRDRFVLSKGHGCASLYVLLSEMGFFPSEELDKFESMEGILGGHPDMKKVPGVEVSTGSLGQGLSIAVGKAIALKLQGSSSSVFCIIGDGECNEGSIWEAIFVVPQQRLDNLVVIVDHNKQQASGSIYDVIDQKSLLAKFKVSGWNAVEVDGHSIEDIYEVLSVTPKISGIPLAIIANTIKGKGISFMENQRRWHTGVPNKDEYDMALSEIENRIVSLGGDI